ncbi:MAG: hypothetical protein JSS31_17990 [Proteobacteria bacterium]|nr:hypothetical protein [Pseudomonadota bacterium]MBS0495790.1 hypothetical protein [Pseudomonadota bacterium]
MMATMASTIMKPSATMQGGRFKLCLLAFLLNTFPIVLSWDEPSQMLLATRRTYPYGTDLVGSSSVKEAHD